jgi:hypothetical protein
MVIKILLNSFPDKQPLTSQELEAAIAIISFIVRYYAGIGIDIGPADLQVIKHPNRGYPQFCPQSLNSKFPCDSIFLSMDSFTFWCQLIFQVSHEITHCVIHRLNSHENQKASWVEETICEAMSLVFLNMFANNWSECCLSKKSPHYYEDIQKYLRGELEKTGNNKLENCNGIMGLKEVEQSSVSNRENRCEEMHQLYHLIQSEDDIRGLVNYRNNVVSGTILLDTQMYQKAYPSSQAVQYLCCLQKDALRRNVAVSKVSEES